MRDEETIFAEALRAGSPVQRNAFLDRACAADPDLRREVEALLAAHEQAAGFLESSPASPTQTLPTGDDAPGSHAARTSSLPHEQPASVVGPYKLLEQIGEGGMGVVFMAEQLRPV